MAARVDERPDVLDPVRLSRGFVDAADGRDPRRTRDDTGLAEFRSWHQVGAVQGRGYELKVIIPYKYIVMCTVQCTDEKFSIGGCSRFGGSGKRGWHVRSSLRAAFWRRVSSIRTTVSASRETGFILRPERAQTW